jgi:hypothetical protein
MILGGGVYNGQALLSPDSFAEWLRPQISFPGLSPDQGGTGADITYASGWMETDVGDRRIINHGGNVLVMTSMTAFDRARGVAVSILFNFYSGLDPYRFTSADSLVNNILRLAAGEKLSDWGVPRVKDVNLSESWIKLSDAQLAAIEGEYTSEKGSHAKVTRGKTGLELSYQLPSSTFNARLEFINPQRGVALGLDPSMPFSLMLNSDNSVRYVTMKGVRLFPKTQVIPKGYGFVNVTTPKLKLLFPEAWEPVITKTGIEAGNGTNRVQISWPKDTVISPEQALLSTEIPQESGNIVVEGISGRTYTQQAFRLAKGRRLLVALTPGQTGVVVIKFYSKDEDASRVQRLILGPLLKYSQWQPSKGAGK